MYLKPVNSNTKNLNNDSHNQETMMNQLLMQTLSTYPIVKTDKLRKNLIIDLTLSESEKIYSFLLPLHVRKAKLHQCIERLDRIISTAKNKQLNLNLKLKQIKDKEKKLVNELVMKKNQNPVINGINSGSLNNSLTKRKNVNSKHNTMVNNPVKAVLRSQSVNSAKTLKTFNSKEKKESGMTCQDRPDEDNSYIMNIISSMTDKKIQTKKTVSFSKCHKKCSFTQNIHHGDGNKMSHKRMESDFRIANDHENKLFESDHMKQKKSQRNESINSEVLCCSSIKPIQIKPNVEQFQTFDKGDIDLFSCNLEMKADSNFKHVDPRKTVQNTNEPCDQIEKRGTPIKSRLSNAQNDDLLKRILTKFDSVKQYIDKYKTNYNVERQINDCQFAQENKKETKQKYIMDWILVNQDFTCSIDANNIFEDCIAASVTKSNDSTSPLKNYQHSMFNFALSDSEEKAKSNIENIFVEIEKCGEENMKFVSDKALRDGLMPKL